MLYFNISNEIFIKKKLNELKKRGGVKYNSFFYFLNAFLKNSSSLLNDIRSVRSYKSMCSASSTM